MSVCSPTFYVSKINKIYVGTFHQNTLMGGEIADRCCSNEWNVKKSEEQKKRKQNIERTEIQTNKLKIN